MNLIGVTYGNGLFVTVSRNGTILTSSDGNSWTQRTSGTSKNLNGVIFQSKEVELVVEEGKEKGTRTSPDGSYVGERKDGKEHGQGTKTFKDGGKYEGEWKNGKYHGQGKLTSSDGKYFVGEFKVGELGDNWEVYLEGIRLGHYKNGEYNPF